MHFWDTNGSTEPIESVVGAHDGPIWTLSWHPLGHLMASGSNDYSTRFWSRARPGDTGFEELLPKKVGAAALEAAQIDAVLRPPAPLGEVFTVGIFAEKPGPLVPLPEKPEVSAEPSPVKALTDVAPARTTSGLSLGEGADKKDVLDTSDFDILDDTVKAASSPAPVSKSPAAVDATGASAKAAPAASGKRPAATSAAEVDALKPTAKAAKVEAVPKTGEGAKKDDKG